ncbi:winged helix-turn-helix transcriptional regulator [Methanolobus sp. WCC4]|uniref:helix-turn-helix transcriptional regulator n=1 Tax=Methanolobus sp. WCC4 TaxID=3125784 RepID=UPI0030F6ACFD
MLKNKIILLCSISIFLLACVPLSNATEVATIHGAVYEWDSFEPLENVIVDVDSTPPQSMLAKYGLYSFDLVPGNYTILASYYRGNDLVAYAEEEVTITDDGDYVMDLILLPVYYDTSFNESEFAELDEIASFSEEGGDSASLSTGTMLVILIIVVVLIAGAYYIVKQRNSGSSPDDGDHVQDADTEMMMSGDKWDDLPEDLRQVVGIIERNDGRITQKDLRTKVKHSEAKVSLMISDLESRGIVRKFKKGRGNVIILEDTADTDEPNQNI